MKCPLFILEMPDFSLMKGAIFGKSSSDMLRRDLSRTAQDDYRGIDSLKSCCSIIALFRVSGRIEETRSF